MTSYFIVSLQHQAASTFEVELVLMREEKVCDVITLAVGLQRGKDKNRHMAPWTIELQSYHTGVVLPWFVGWPRSDWSW